MRSVGRLPRSETRGGSDSWWGRSLHTSLALQLGRQMHRLADLLIRAAAADAVAHGLVDIRLRWIRRLGEQRRRRHDLPALAIAALGHVFLNPGLLDGVRAIGGEPLDRSYLLARDAGDRRHAGPNRLPVDVHGACPAQRHPASEFGARHPERVPQNPEQRHGGRHVYSLGLSIECESDCCHRWSEYTALLRASPHWLAIF